MGLWPSSPVFTHFIHSYHYNSSTEVYFCCFPTIIWIYSFLGQIALASGFFFFFWLLPTFPKIHFQILYLVLYTHTNTQSCSDTSTIIKNKTRRKKMFLVRPDLSHRPVETCLSSSCIFKNIFNIIPHILMSVSGKLWSFATVWCIIVLNICWINKWVNSINHNLNFSRILIANNLLLFIRYWHQSICASISVFIDTATHVYLENSGGRPGPFRFLLYVIVFILLVWKINI